MKIRLVLHIHTDYSPDSYVTPKDIIYQCNKHKIDCIGITDHNTADGAIKYKENIEKAGIRVIVGEEIMTDSGEIIGLFLDKTINNMRNNRKVTLSEAIDEIQAQKALVFAPHPFDMLRSGIGKKNLKLFQDKIDAFEIFNSRTKINHFNKLSERYVHENGLTPFIGSDAHISREIANSIIEMDDFKTKEEFIENLKKPNVKYYKKRLQLRDVIRPSINKLKKKIQRVFTSL